MPAFFRPEIKRKALGAIDGGVSEREQKEKIGEQREPFGREIYMFFR